MIPKLVKTIIDIYMKEDYEYVISQAKENNKIAKTVPNVNQEMEFIRSNNLIPDNMSQSDLEEASKQIIERITEIDLDIYRMHSNLRVITIETIYQY